MTGSVLQTSQVLLFRQVLTDGISDEDGLRLIRNELIDGASSEINDMSDYLLGFLYAEGDE